MIFNTTESATIKSCALSEALNNLNPIQILLCHLVYQGFTTREMAEKFSCSHVSIVKQLQRIRKEVTKTINL
jgi:DNA-directed RNA polymerase specialized sigma24 family protein